MEYGIEYWHWVVFGMVLMLAELMITTFAIFWFGLGALIVGGLLFLGFEPALKWQIFIWVLSSLGFTLAWFKWIKPLSIDRTKAGLSREAVVGERGIIIRAPGEGARGEVRFTLPIHGSDTWACIAEEPVCVGDTVVVKDVMGNALVVSPLPKHKTENG